MNIERGPQPHNPEENEDTSEYTPEIQSILDSKSNTEEKSQQLEEIKDHARKQLEKITNTREQIQNQREEFIANDKLTRERKEDYEEAIRLLDRKEQTEHKKIKEAQEARRILAVRSEKEEVN